MESDMMTKTKEMIQSFILLLGAQDSIICVWITFHVAFKFPFLSSFPLYRCMKMKVIQWARFVPKQNLERAIMIRHTQVYCLI